jgi:hypothetical protein
LETLQPLSGDRKCFRMINGVLTERTVKDVVPILQTNSDGLKQALEELVKQYKLKQDEMEKWKVRHRSTKPPSQYHTTNSPTEEEQRTSCPAARAVDGYQRCSNPLTGWAHGICWEPHEMMQPSTAAMSLVTGNGVDGAGP